MTQSPTDPTDTEALLAGGGGNATAAGVNFQASLGAMFAARLLTERPLDERLRLNPAYIRSIRFETEAPVDDLLLETSDAGFVFVQAKTTLSLSDQLNSEFGKTVEQIVRLWRICSAGLGAKGWDRPLDPLRDRILIAVGPGASGTIATELATALASMKAASHVALPQAQQAALARFTHLLNRAWVSLFGGSAPASDIDDITRLVTILKFDLAGADRTASIETLSHVMEDATASTGAFDAIAKECERLMAARHGTNAEDLRRSVSRTGFPIRSAPSFQADVEKLRAYSARIQAHLLQYEDTRVAGSSVKIERQCTDAVVAAATDGPLVLVGDPGAGKSAVVSAAAEKLRAEGKEVIEFAVDRLPVETLDGLRVELELTHSLRSVLDNWPGSDDAFLFIDALDATRGGKSEAVFRSVIEDVMALPERRWRVIASIRTFDLRLGEQFRNLFAGDPPDDRYKDDNFSAVRHLHIPGWTKTELDDFLAKAPDIETAINRGGQRLRDLALVPFNTRLLADLISGGADANAFGDVGSQVELLAMYWGRRVESHGAGAELCLSKAVTAMVHGRILQASKIETAKDNPAALDALLRENVLVTLRSNRYVAFRHHILFDYAASRLFIDIENLRATGDLLRADQSLGLMLAPALSFALQELWAEGGAGRDLFWSAIAQFAGTIESNPVARSVAARVACELPEVPRDMGGFKNLFAGTRADRDLAFRAFSHVVGALTVRLEDKQHVHMKPWCNLAAEASVHVAEVVWPLRTLLFQFVERAAEADERAWLGRAARALLGFALGKADIVSAITASAIGFVADTFATDPAESAALLRLVMASDRLREHAHEDMPWLARKVRVIAASDPALAIDIYKVVFGYVVDDMSETSMGNSRIMPLTSNRRQDYDHARWTLKETFPVLLREQPLPALQAMVFAIEGNVAIKHPIAEDAQAQVIQSTSGNGLLVEDLSHVWAWNPDDTHEGNAGGLIKAFTKRLQEVAPADAQQIVREMIRINRLAVFWARMFMVGAKRPGDLGPLLWPYATSEPVLRSYDTRKDAIDFIAAVYDLQQTSEREAFECRTMALEFPASEDPARARQRFLLNVFAPVGAERLATAEARELVRAAPQEQQARPNRRPFEVVVGSGSPERFWWLERKGVDLNAPANLALLEQTEALSDVVGLRGKEVESLDVAAASRDVRELFAAAKSATQQTDAGVVSYAEDVVSQVAEKLAQQTDALKQHPTVLADLCRLIESLLDHPSPETEPDIEEKFCKSLSSAGGVRVNAVEAALFLCRIDGPLAQRFVPKLEERLRDPHPAVRLTLANRLPMLWHTARSDMWRFAEIMARNEVNLGILRFLAATLLQLVHADPEKTEALAYLILPRAGEDTGDAPVDRLSEVIGRIITLLWVSHERPRAKATLDAWLTDPPTHDHELHNGLSSIREGLVLGYAGSNSKDAAIRTRCQMLAGAVVESTANGLERLAALSGDEVTEVEKERGTAFAKLLDHASDQFFFASGAFSHGEKSENPPLADVVLKRAFLLDNEATFRRIGDIGTPPTIYHLIELFQFLVPAGPERVFDLVAHALLNAGRKHGFQFDSLGADRFVELIGLFLADHRPMFSDNVRREQLVACLDAFVEVGWPAARRLLYRLPELLQ